MQNEVVPPVLQVVERIRTNTPKRSVTEVIERAGVRDAQTKRSDYAWALQGGGYLLTIWSEFVRVQPNNGRWFYVDSLDTETRLGGGARGPLQRARAEYRIQCLNRLYSGKEDFLAVLQVNRLSIAELERNENASVGVRVKDDERWYVAAWDEERRRAILVRGARGWCPTLEDIDHSPATDSTTPPDAHGPNSGEPQPRLVFPDQAHRDLVEATAMEYVTGHYTKQGLVVSDVSPENKGYDLEVADLHGAVLHVEVKGTSTQGEGFFLTRNERRAADALPSWQLAVVTSALDRPILRVYSAAEMESLFSFDPLVWRCSRK